MNTCCFNTLFNRFSLFGGGFNISVPNISLYGEPLNFSMNRNLLPYETIFSSSVAPQYNFSGCNPYLGTLGLTFTPPTNFSFVPPSPLYNQSNNIFGNLTKSDYKQNNSQNNQSNPISALLSLCTTKKATVSTKVKNNQSKKQPVYNTNTNLPALKDVGYNEAKAQKLSTAIGKTSSEGGFDGYCARHVKNAIQNAGLGAYKNGHAYQMPQILAGNKNFKEVSTKGLNLSNLPAGCILVYDKNNSNYSGKYGHTEITLGDGTAAAGGITHNIREGARVYVPV